MDKLAIYIHFPFCLSKCSYCAFYSEKFDSTLYSAVIKKILLDIEYLSARTGCREVVSIFFGGGTPSLMAASDIGKIIDYIAKFHIFSDIVEITLEANPETINIDKLNDLARSGVNRISLGIQSFLRNELAFLGRRCSDEQTLNAAEAVSKIFKSYNFDLIYGFSTQTPSTLAYSLKQAVQFSPTHMSCYRLTYEKNTILHQKMLAGELSDISEDDEINLFDTISSMLQTNGFQRYEISNFAKPKHECIHNLMYWEYNDYYGIGASSHGRITLNGKKYAIEYANNINDWIKSDCKLYELSKTDSTNEAIIMGLRTINGVNISKLHLSNKQMKKIDDLVKQQVMTLENNRLKIKNEYLDVCDYITRDIVSC